MSKLNKELGKIGIRSVSPRAAESAPSLGPFGETQLGRKLKLVSFFLLISSICFGQTTWFKHLPGFHGRTSIVKNDTILTTGMDAIYKSFGYKFGVFLSWNSVNGESIDSMKFNLDSLEKDSITSTLLSSNYNASNFYKNGSQHFLRIGNGLKNERTFLMSFDKFYSHTFQLEEYTIDTFQTYIDNILNHPTGNISVTQNYNSVKKIAYTTIYKGEKERRKKINEYQDYLYKRHQTANHILNNKTNNSFFFKLTITGAFSSLQYWEDYIIKMDTLGNEIWRCQPNNRDSINPLGMQFVQKTNGNILVSWCDMMYRPFMTASKNELSEPNYQCTIWFAEIDTSGKVLWRKNIKKYLNYKLKSTDHDLEHIKAINVKDGTLWAGSYYQSRFFHTYLLKTDYNGNPIWFREYELYPTNSVKSEFKPYDLSAATDGGYIITGEYISDSSNIFPVFSQLATIIKVDSFGCLEPGCQEGDSVISVKTIQKGGFKLYPNPNSGNFIIEMDNPSNDISIELYDIIGNLIKIVETNPNKKSYAIEMDVANGVYVVRLRNGGMIFNQKVSIAR